MSLFLGMLTSQCDSALECFNISFSETKLYGVDQNSTGLDYCIRGMEGKFYGLQQTEIVCIRHSPCQDVLEKLKV